MSCWIQASVSLPKEGVDVSVITKREMEPFRANREGRFWHRAMITADGWSTYDIEIRPDDFWYEIVGSSLKTKKKEVCYVVS